MLSKSLIQFSVDGWSCVLSLMSTWGQTMVEVMKLTMTAFKRSHACAVILSAPNPTAGHHQPMPLPETPDTQRQVWISLLWALLPSPELWHTRFHLCPPRVYFLVPCKFWQLCGRVNGDLLQEGLCRIQACCTLSPRPYNTPLLTHTSTRDAQTQFCLSLCGVPRSWCSQGLPESSQCPQRECCLMPNANSPLLPSCWGLPPTLG